MNGTVSHEFIIDSRGFKNTAELEPEDVAKRFMDYGFHGPTMSWLVPCTLMIKPIESESKAELDKYGDALISIGKEIIEVEKGNADIQNNVHKGAPHPPSLLMANAWTKPYSGEYAAFPASWPLLQSFGLPQDVLIMCTVTATSFIPFLPTYDHDDNSLLLCFIHPQLISLFST